MAGRGLTSSQWPNWKLCTCRPNLQNCKRLVAKQTGASCDPALNNGLDQSCLAEYQQATLASSTLNPTCSSTQACVTENLATQQAATTSGTLTFCNNLGNCSPAYNTCVNNANALNQFSCNCWDSLWSCLSTNDQTGTCSAQTQNLRYQCAGINADTQYNLATGRFSTGCTIGTCAAGVTGALSLAAATGTAVAVGTDDDADTDTGVVKRVNGLDLIPFHFEIHEQENTTGVLYVRKPSDNDSANIETTLNSQGTGLERPRRTKKPTRKGKVGPIWRNLLQVVNNDDDNILTDDDNTNNDDDNILSDDDNNNNNNDDDNILSDDDNSNNDDDNLNINNPLDGDDDSPDWLWPLLGLLLLGLLCLGLLAWLLSRRKRRPMYIPPPQPAPIIATPVPATPVAGPPIAPVASVPYDDFGYGAPGPFL
eukprot:TRINITY_DN67319_c1_g1_i1.p2 TRINITY_DN67319_c1_g1~~TRINITY_DN67319_c1_g1_i1.p2  ORF type:complete len:473 (+),score=59.18 TRINITY_DN67319_c1_g1_i1:150-1421(+)